MRVSIRRAMAGTTWVAVCNGYRAQVYEWVRPGGPLLQLEVMVHAHSRRKNLDISADPRNFPQEVESQIFAREVAGFLESRAHRGEFGDLVLIAPPRFQGLLQELLSDLLDRMTVKTVDKDLTAVKPHELRKVLEEVLPAL